MEPWYCAVTPDLRGFGDSDAPPDAPAYTCLHVVGDIVALIESLRSSGGEGVFVVAHDWGTMIGWYLCLFCADLVKAFVPLTVPFHPRHPAVKTVTGMKALFGEDYYMCRFQEVGTIEDEIVEYGSKAVIKKILTDQTPGLPRLPLEDLFGPKADIANIKLPPWFSQEDLNYYSGKYDQRGFTSGLNYYRNLDRNWELATPWDGANVKVPVKFVVGDLDIVYATPGVKKYVHGGGFKADVLLLEDCIVLENTGHFINQERIEEVN